MKKLQLTILAVCFLALSLIIWAESNLYFAVKEAGQAETDGEIEQILHEYGFRIHIYEEITPEEKIKALFRPFITE